MTASPASQAASPASQAEKAAAQPSPLERSVHAPPTENAAAQPSPPERPATRSRARRQTNICAMERTIVGAIRPDRTGKKRFKLELVQAGVDDVLARMNLTRRQNVLPSQSWVDGLAVEESTKRAYDKHLRGLLYFFGLIGDFESLIILQPDAPHNVPAMNVDSILLYLDWRTLEEGTHLQRADGTAVLDTFGAQILSSGSWLDPDNVTQMGSALKAIHQKFDHRGAYQGVCPDCQLQRALTPPNRLGCDRHSPAPLIWRKGVPTQSTVFENAFKRIKKDLKDYRANGDTQLTPTEVLILRDYCMKENDPYFFMVYTIFIVFVKMFMRNDDAKNLDFNDFEESFFVINNNVVEKLAVWVDGKTEKRHDTKSLLLLHRDRDVPEFDAISHLLAHVGSLQLTSGCLFPGKRWFSCGRKIEHLRPITYDEFNKVFQELCRRLLRRRGPFGVHCARKTAYLFAVWYGANLIEAMKAARHAATVNATRYYKDAGAVINLIKATTPDDIVSRVQPKWQPVFVESGHVVRENLTMHSRRPGNELRSLVVLASEYIQRLQSRHFLGFDDHGHGISCQLLSQAILQREEVVDDPFQRYASALQRARASMPELMVEIDRAVQDMLEHVRQSATVTAAAVANVESIERAGDSLLSNEPLVASQAVEKRRQQMFGDFDIDRSQLGKLKTSQKLQFLVEIWQQCHAVDSARFSNPFRLFFSQSLRPLMECLTGHFQGDQAAFTEAWSTQKCKHRLFGRDLCNGKERCTLTRTL